MYTCSIGTFAVLYKTALDKGYLNGCCNVVKMSAFTIFLDKSSFTPLWKN